MADAPQDGPQVEIVGGAAPAAPATEAPAVAETVAAPAVEAPVTEAPATEAPETAPGTVAETPSLLEDVKGETEKPAEEAKPEEKVEEKPAETKPDEKPAEVKAEEKAPAEPAKPEPPPAVEYKYELPETVQLNDELRGEFHGVLDAFRADPANVQPLIDFHNARLSEAVQAVGQQQHTQFNDTRRAWNDEIKGDEVMGGSGFETTKKTVARMRDALVSSHTPGTPEYQKEMQEFVTFCRITGAGDHPAMWRLLHNAARYLDEGAMPPIDARPAPQGKQPGSRRALIYNHPTSPNNKD